MIGKIRAAFAAIGAIFVAIASAWILGRRAGASSATTKAKGADYARAEEIRARAAAARDADHTDPVAELRRRGRIRD